MFVLSKMKRCGCLSIFGWTCERKWGWDSSKLLTFLWELTKCIKIVMAPFVSKGHPTCPCYIASSNPNQCELYGCFLNWKTYTLIGILFAINVSLIQPVLQDIHLNWFFFFLVSLTIRQIAVQQSTGLFAPVIFGNMIFNLNLMIDIISDYGERDVIVEIHVTEHHRQWSLSSWWWLWSLIRYSFQRVTKRIKT